MLLQTVKFLEVKFFFSFLKERDGTFSFPILFTQTRFLDSRDGLYPQPIPLMLVQEVTTLASGGLLAQIIGLRSL